jgi:hypothetical protein
MQKVGRFGVANDPPDGGAADARRGMPQGPTNLTTVRAIQRETRPVDAQRTKHADVEAWFLNVLVLICSIWARRMSACYLLFALLA